MKKIINIFLLMVVMYLLVACGKINLNDNDDHNIQVELNDAGTITPEEDVVIGEKEEDVQETENQEEENTEESGPKGDGPTTENQKEENVGGEDVPANENKDDGVYGDTAEQENSNDSDENGEDEVRTATNLTIGYIPLDNRPVNDQRPIYQTEGAGMTLLMPEEYLFATRLDGMSPNPNGSMYGDRAALLLWLKENEKNCDIFVISLDQMLSGGLVSSRALTNEDLSFEYEIVDYLCELSRRKTVYIIDTVMRLASTVNYNGLQLEEYYEYRAYGKVERKVLSDEELTLENIYNGYRFDVNGEKISTSIDENALKDYHNSRIRKLKLIDRLLKNAKDIKYCYIGVDDSSPYNSIQTNEVNYIKKLLGDNGTIFCGTDELGMMAIAKAYADYWDVIQKVSVSYFGGKENEYADEFDFDTLRTNVEKHVASLGGYVTNENADIEMLVMTKGCSYEESVELINRWRRNEREGIKTIVVDVSYTEHNFNVLLEDIPTDYTMGYSCWGTAGNAIGISLAMGYTRSIYLEKEPNITTEADIAFAKGLIFSFVKDMSYCRGCRPTLFVYTPEAIESHVMNRDYQYNAPYVISKLMGERILSGNKGDFFTIPEFELTDFCAPLQRQYEIRFQIKFKE